MRTIKKLGAGLAAVGAAAVGTAQTNVTFVGPPDASGLASGVTGVYTVCVGIALLALAVGFGIRYARRGLAGR